MNLNRRARKRNIMSPWDSLLIIDYVKKSWLFDQFFLLITYKHYSQKSGKVKFSSLYTHDLHKPNCSSYPKIDIEEFFNAFLHLFLDVFPMRNWKNLAINLYFTSNRRRTQVIFQDWINIMRNIVSIIIIINDDNDLLHHIPRNLIEIEIPFVSPSSIALQLFNWIEIINQHSFILSFQITNGELSCLLSRSTFNSTHSTHYM
jgi:hypothetical protein